MEENRKILPPESLTPPPQTLKFKPYEMELKLEPFSNDPKPSTETVKRPKHHIGLYPIDDGRGSR